MSSPRRLSCLGAGCTWRPGSLTLGHVLPAISHGLLFISFKLHMTTVDTEALWFFQTNQSGDLTESRLWPGLGFVARPQRRRCGPYEC